VDGSYNNMKCPFCGQQQSRVIKTFGDEYHGEIIQRVRKCLVCGFPWLTIEVVVTPTKREDSEK